MPIRSSQDAVRLLQLAISLPLEHETLAFLLDDEGVGGVITSIEDTRPLESVLNITAVMSRVGADVPGLCSLVVASVRPGSGLVPGDIDRWLEASEIAEAHGIALLEWYVVDRLGFHCPRELIGEPPRWRQR
jgi:hypothetical protein